MLVCRANASFGLDSEANREKEDRMFEKFARKMQSFMVGRNGVDSLGRAVVFLAFAFIILSLVVPEPTVRAVFSWLAFASLVYCYFRMFSKNIAKRYKENCAWERFARKWGGPFKGRAKQASTWWKYRKTHRVFRCAQCGQSLRVPKGKGKVKVTCPKCKSSFVAKS